MPSFNNNNYFI